MGRSTPRIGHNTNAHTTYCESLVGLGAQLFASVNALREGGRVQLRQVQRADVTLR